jgi:hypothetical protein
MAKCKFFAAILAGGLLATPASQSWAETFDPNTQSFATYNLFDVSGVDNPASLEVDILNYSFASGLGVYGMNEESPFTSFGSDQMTLSNTGANNWGVISVLSEDLPRFATTCNGAADEAASPYCIVNAQLANSNIGLIITLFSPAGDGPNLLSDTLTIQTTPLPAALPLFGTGLGALGLFRWRRKRKVLAA